MKNYFVRLQDRFINDEYVSSLLFDNASFKASSCKQLAKRIAQTLKSNDYELRYFRRMNMYILRLIYISNSKFTVVTYIITAFKNL